MMERRVLKWRQICCCAALLAFMCGVPACNKANEEHLQPQKMEGILVDIGLAETYSTMVNDSAHHFGVKNIDSLAKFYNEILAHHNVTIDQFRTSLDWYKHHPEDMDTLYNHVAASMDKLSEAENRKVRIKQ